MYYGVPIFLLFLYHSYHMIFSTRIDYGYNMKFTVFIAVIHHTLLLGWGIWVKILSRILLFSLFSVYKSL